MPKYKLSPEERVAEQERKKERKENLRNIIKGLDVKNFENIKDVFKLMFLYLPLLLQNLYFICSFS